MKDVKISNCYQHLICRHCESIRVTPQKTTIYCLDGRITTCDKSEQKTTQNTDTSTNKSNDIFAITINYYCKSCKSYSKMCISNHLDSKLCEWAFGLAKPVHIDEEDI